MEQENEVNRSFDSKIHDWKTRLRKARIKVISCHDLNSLEMETKAYPLTDVAHCNYMVYHSLWLHIIDASVKPDEKDTVHESGKDVYSYSIVLLIHHFMEYCN